MKNSLPELRRARQWSQQRLADEVGVSRRTIVSIETGKFDPSLPLAFRLAATFSLRIDDIFEP
ncbi:hypothetical protein ASG56_02075 [Rhodococcus sp. Leaf7]|uniref:helix-turn-helix transcriptional regulator n=1 Tax=unclassified Rhodococcus (in: high G+C Gram-positive bacteria) TaxID=192944 RepID=UPI0005ACB9E4|nr:MULTISPECIES: helix-turn-helix transcriptional regulator [unclassified Rhodococcus (in: high G+C Gram-positive bacteria)]KIQ17191.1 hypothetical protein RU01_11675 [Rhodococcus sp. MEB064]KQU06484.1 hypothetical protein ASG56_02075 [Rhodococcus sp. Leaf7]KQU42002.1 hypothetical protein ASG64_02075 [Rhodococcus sp. Leaf247]